MLFGLAFALTVLPERGKMQHNLTSLGLLQLAWLVGNDGHFSGVQRPHIQGLRRAGQFEVVMNEWARRRNHDQSGTEAESHEGSELMKSEEMQ
jgi:hypothetical protein